MWQRGKTTGFYNKLLSYLDSSLSDHGILRVFWSSWEELPGKMYRSNQPYPYQIKKFVKKYKIKSIINLRGKRYCSSYFLERDYCVGNGIKLYDYPISSRDMPSKEKILNFFSLINKVEYPALIHCKSGADRAGIMCALYMLIYKKQHPDIAKKQLSWKYLHVKWAKPGVLDAFVESYSIEYKKNKFKFMDWVKNKYNPEKLESSFRSVWWLNRFLDDILRRE